MSSAASSSTVEIKKEPLVGMDAEHSLYGYAAGTWGPKEAEDLLAKDGREWRFPCKNLTHTHFCEL